MQGSVDDVEEKRLEGLSVYLCGELRIGKKPWKIAETGDQSQNPKFIEPPYNNSVVLPVVCS